MIELLSPPDRLWLKVFDLSLILWRVSSLWALLFSRSFLSCSLLNLLWILVPLLFLYGLITKLFYEVYYLAKDNALELFVIKLLSLWKNPIKLSTFELFFDNCVLSRFLLSDYCVGSLLIMVSSLSRVVSMSVWDSSIITGIVASLSIKKLLFCCSDSSLTSVLESFSSPVASLRFVILLRRGARWSYPIRATPLVYHLQCFSYCMKATPYLIWSASICLRMALLSCLPN